MIKFIAGAKDGVRTIGLGLSHKNLEMLKEGRPVQFSMSEIIYGELITEIRATDQMFIFSDVDEDTMLKKLRELRIDIDDFRDFRK